MSDQLLSAVPAPWYALGPNAVRDATHKHICNVTGEDRAIKQALIVVAPDLLAACEAQEAVDAHIRACEDCSDGEWCDDCFDLDKHATALRREALARVKGEEVTA